MKNVAVLGSGSVGETLSNGFLKHGFEVMRGSRDPKKLEDWKAKLGGKAQIGTFADAAKWGDLVVLAVKGSAAEQVVEPIADSLRGKTVLDTTNPIADAKPEDGVLHFFTGPNDSLMERLQKRFAGVHFVKCFSSVGAARMVNPDFGGQKPTMFICGDDEHAKSQTKTILETFGWDHLDCGTSKAARAIEPVCMLWCIPGFRSNHWTHAMKVIGL